MVVRKRGGKPKKEKPDLGPKGPKVPKSVKIDSLEDAIQDGRILCTPGERLVLRKDYLWEVTTSYVVVKRIIEQKGVIDLWDETAEQWTAVEAKSASQFTLKRLRDRSQASRVEDTVVDQERKDDVPVDEEAHAGNGRPHEAGDSD